MRQLLDSSSGPWKWLVLELAEAAVVQCHRIGAAVEVEDLSHPLPIGALERPPAEPIPRPLYRRRLACLLES